MIVRPLFFTAAVILLVGCAHYSPKPFSAEQMAESFQARSLDNPELKKFIELNFHREIKSWPLRSLDFQMLTLAALYYHPDMDVVRAQWEVAKGGIVTAGARPNPTIGYFPTYITHVQSGLPPWAMGGDFNLPIETMGKRKKRIDRAKHLTEAARLNIRVAAWKVRSRLRTSLLSLYSVTQTEAVLNQQKNIQEDNVHLLEERLALGEVSHLSLDQARLALGRTLVLLHESKKQKVEMRMRVAEAMGLPAQALDGININFDFLNYLPADIPSNEMRRNALRSRIDILSSLEEYAASEAALRLEIAKQYPDLHISPNYLWDQGQDKWTLGVFVQLPILDQNQGPIAEAKAKREEAKARFIALQTQIIGEIDRSLLGYQVSLQKLEAAETLLSTQKHQKNFIEATSIPGELQRIALLNAQVELDTATLLRLDAFVQAQQSLGIIEDALQRPLNQREIVVNSEKNTEKINVEGVQGTEAIHEVTKRV